MFVFVCACVLVCLWNALCVLLVLFACEASICYHLAKGDACTVKTIELVKGPEVRMAKGNAYTVKRD